MSVELNWEALTTGPDGEALAERIRAFIHDKFQTVALSRFISSVKVHGFDFGSVAPSLALKDVTDPLPEFYTAALDDEESDTSDEDEPTRRSSRPHASGSSPVQASDSKKSKDDGRRRPAALRPSLRRNDWPGIDSYSPFLGTSTPGFLGGPGLNYFQSHIGSGGTHTPLAAVAGAHLTSSWLGSTKDPVRRRRSASEDLMRQSSQSHLSDLMGPGSPEDDRVNTAAAWAAQSLREKSSVSTLAPSSDGTSRPPTRGTVSGSAAAAGGDENIAMMRDSRSPPSPPRGREARPDDMQAIFRIRYAGDVRLQLTAEILLDYPMPSFVSIPLKLNITGLSFDGVGVLAYIRRRVHFCFLSPEDAVAAAGRDDDDEDEDEEESAGGFHKHGGSMGGLLQEIRIESEIGERDGGKQSLKNVGKVERFVLEQVRRIFEEEFVYPSFWTFLV